MPVPDAIATCRPPPSRRRIRAVFVGWGAINGRVGSLLAARNAAVEIVGIATLNTPENRIDSVWRSLPCFALRVGGVASGYRGRGRRTRCNRHLG